MDSDLVEKVATLIINGSADTNHQMEAELFVNGTSQGNHLNVSFSDGEHQLEVKAGKLSDYCKRR